jgi:hypothetical protein
VSYAVLIDGFEKAALILVPATEGMVEIAVRRERRLVSANRTYQVTANSEVPQAQPHVAQSPTNPAHASSAASSCNAPEPGQAIAA